MKKVTKAGAIVVPATPGFYHHPESVQDMVDFMVGKLCSIVGVETHLLPEWKGKVTED